MENLAAKIPASYHIPAQHRLDYSSPYQPAASTIGHDYRITDISNCRPLADNDGKCMIMP